MIEIIKITISNQSSKVELLDTIYTNNKEQYRVHFIFDTDDWNNYNKMVVFDRVKNYDTPIGINITKENSELVEIINEKEFYCVLPWEVITQPGYFNISIYGTYTNDKGELLTKNYILPDKFTIQNGGDKTVYPRIPTPNMYEQLVNISETLKTDTAEAKEKAEQAISNTNLLFYTTNTLKEVVNEHTDNISEIEIKVADKPNNYVFDTEEELRDWISIKDNVKKLNIGDTFYIKDIKTSDYWWNGEEIQFIKAKPSDLDNEFDSITIQAEEDYYKSIITGDGLTVRSASPANNFLATYGPAGISVIDDNGQYDKIDVDLFTGSLSITEPTEGYEGSELTRNSLRMYSWANQTNVILSNNGVTAHDTSGNELSSSWLDIINNASAGEDSGEVSGDITVDSVFLSSDEWNSFYTSITPTTFSQYDIAVSGHTNITGGNISLDSAQESNGVHVEYKTWDETGSEMSITTDITGGKIDLNSKVALTDTGVILNGTTYNWSDVVAGSGGGSNTPSDKIEATVIELEPTDSLIPGIQIGYNDAQESGGGYSFIDRDSISVNTLHNSSSSVLQPGSLTITDPNYNYNKEVTLTGSSVSASGSSATWEEIIIAATSSSGIGDTVETVKINLEPKDDIIAGLDIGYSTAVLDRNEYVSIRREGLTLGTYTSQASNSITPDTITISGGIPGGSTTITPGKIQLEPSNDAYIKVGYNKSLEDGLTYTSINRNSIRIDSITNSDESIGFTVEGISYKGEDISWNRIINAVKAIENMVDVSTNGQ